MTCRGYDSKAVKVPKSVKRLAATAKTPELRRGMIKSYAATVAANARTGNRRPGPAE
jgi:hypothetical protein